MNRKPLITNEMYHIYNRGADKRSIFGNDKDRHRFLNNLYEFNDENPARTPRYEKSLFTEVEPRLELVKILAYCLMPNHFHLMLKQVADGGIAKFMQKLCTGYTMYFNKINERTGVLFQGRFKSVHVQSDNQAKYLPHYIHLNPVYDRMKSNNKVENKELFEGAKKYRWSSLGEYLGNDTNHLVDPKAIDEFYQSGYENDLRDWIKIHQDNELLDVLLD